MGLRGELPVRRPAGELADLPELSSELLDGPGGWI
jgi:hypothetical protein